MGADNGISANELCLQIDSCLALSTHREQNTGHDPLTKEGIKELKELFTSLANEFDTKPNRVTYIHIVATAQTDKELKAMGY